jgi:hypothetical protein
VAADAERKEEGCTDCREGEVDVGADAGSCRGWGESGPAGTHGSGSTKVALKLVYCAHCVVHGEHNIPIVLIFCIYANTEVAKQLPAFGLTSEIHQSCPSDSS